MRPVRIEHQGGLTGFGKLLREAAAGRAPRRSSPEAEAKLDVTARRLFTPVMPVQGESLRGVVYRACSINGLPNAWGFVQHLGVRNRNRMLLSESADIEGGYLAYALGIDEAEVLSRRYPDLGSCHRSFFGLDLHARGIETRRRRFSPAAFRAGNKIHRAAWEVRAIPFCLGHWDMLQDTCWCESAGVVQGWTRTSTSIGACDRCGDPLSQIHSAFVPEHMRPGLSVLTALVDPIEANRHEAAKQLPEMLQGADRSAMFNLVLRLTAAIDPEAEDHSIEDPGHRLDGLWKACVALTCWPKGFEQVEFHPDFPASAKARLRQDWFSILPPGRTLPANPVGIRPAVHLAHLSPEVLTFGWENGLLTPHLRAHGRRNLPAFDPAELVGFGDMWRKRVSPESLAYELGISLHGVEQLAALGILADDAPALHGTGPHFHAETIEAFITRLENAAEASDASSENPISLADAMRWIGGRPKPWGPVFQSMLAGRIRFRIEAGNQVADSIMISRASMIGVTSAFFDRTAHDFPFSDRIHKRDALALLNYRGGRKPVLTGLVESGVNPKTYLVRDIEERASKFVTIPEIGLVLGMDPATAYHFLRDAGEVEELPGLWRRSLLQDVGLVHAASTA